MGNNNEVPEQSNHTDSVRDFNRFYTQKIGLLSDRFLDTPFSLTQARVLYELAKAPGAKSADLVKTLVIDPGYLSRVIKTFEEQRLISRSNHKRDRRVSRLSLTPLGRKQFRSLNQRSNVQIQGLLGHLDEHRQQQLLDSMRNIRELLDAKPSAARSFALRAHRPGDIGWVVARHGELYAQEYSWDSSFEGLVAEIAGRFLQRHDPNRERCWVAETEGERIGCIFLVKGSKTVAKLRLLLVEPSARGMGVGKALVAECIAFARQAGYRKVTLWTNDILTAARKIYQAAGFHLVKEQKHHSFGHDLVGQFWELKL